MFGKDKQIDEIKRRMYDLEGKFATLETKVLESLNRCDMLGQQFNMVIEGSGSTIRSLQNTINRLKRATEDETGDLIRKKIKEQVADEVVGIIGVVGDELPDQRRTSGNKRKIS